MLKIKIQSNEYKLDEYCIINTSNIKYNEKYVSILLEFFLKQNMNLLKYEIQIHIYKKYFSIVYTTDNLKQKLFWYNGIIETSKYLYYSDNYDEYMSLLRNLKLLKIKKDENKNI